MNKLSYNEPMPETLDLTNDFNGSNDMDMVVVDDDYDLDIKYGKNKKALHNHITPSNTTVTTQSSNNQSDTQNSQDNINKNNNNNNNNNSNNNNSSNNNSMNNVNNNNNNNNNNFNNNINFLNKMGTTLSSIGNLQTALTSVPTLPNFNSYNSIKNMTPNVSSSNIQNLISQPNITNNNSSTNNMSFPTMFQMQSLNSIGQVTTPMATTPANSQGNPILASQSNSIQNALMYQTNIQTNNQRNVNNNVNNMFVRHGSMSSIGNTPQKTNTNNNTNFPFGNINDGNSFSYNLTNNTISLPTTSLPYFNMAGPPVQTPKFNNNTITNDENNQNLVNTYLNPVNIKKELNKKNKNNFKNNNKKRNEQEEGKSESITNQHAMNVKLSDLGHTKSPNITAIATNNLINSSPNTNNIMNSQPIAYPQVSQPNVFFPNNLSNTLPQVYYYPQMNQMNQMNQINQMNQLPPMNGYAQDMSQAYYTPSIDNGGMYQANMYNNYGNAYAYGLGSVPITDNKGDYGNVNGNGKVLMTTSVAHQNIGGNTAAFDINSLTHVPINTLNMMDLNGLHNLNINPQFPQVLYISHDDLSNETICAINPINLIKTSEQDIEDWSIGDEASFCSQRCTIVNLNWQAKIPFARIRLHWGNDSKCVPLTELVKIVNNKKNYNNKQNIINGHNNNNNNNNKYIGDRSIGPRRTKQYYNRSRTKPFRYGGNNNNSINGNNENELKSVEENPDNNNNNNSNNNIINNNNNENKDNDSQKLNNNNHNISSKLTDETLMKLPHLRKHKEYLKTIDVNLGPKDYNSYRVSHDNNDNKSQNDDENESNIENASTNDSMRYYDRTTNIQNLNMNNNNNSNNNNIMNLNNNYTNNGNNNNMNNNNNNNNNSNNLNYGLKRRNKNLKKSEKGDLFKTELCENWVKKGSCTYGRKCHFAHGVRDLKNRMRIENYKTQPCCDPARKDSRLCLFGRRCNYAHPGEPLRRSMPEPYLDEDYEEALIRDYGDNEPYPYGIYI